MHNLREPFDHRTFIKITPDGAELRYQFKTLQTYSEDKVKFMTKVEVREDKTDEERNEIEIVKEPIHSNQEIITFLLVLKWFPNSMKSYKSLRKASFASTEKDLGKNKGKAKIESVQLLHIVFLLSEKIYVPQKYADEFIHIVSERNEVHHRQINCMTILLQNITGKDNFLSTNFASSQSQYHEYLYQTNSNRSEYHNDRSSVASSNDAINKMAVLKRISGRISEKSPRFAESLRQSEVKSINLEENRKRQVNCNLSKIKRYFSAIEYLITEGEVKPEMIMNHLNDDKNIINLGYHLSTVAEFLKEWPKHSSFASLYQLNKEKIMEQQTSQCLSNYKVMISMELSEVNSIKIENIYLIIKEFHSKAIDSFLHSTQQFIHESNYNDYVTHIESQLNSLEAELINNYAFTKYEYGQRILKDLEKKKGKKGAFDNYSFMRIIGREQISNLDIGYKMYKQIIENKLGESFQELANNKNQLKNRFSAFTGNNDEDMLNNIENRIEICQEKRKMLENAIELSYKEAESLQLMIRNMEKGQNELNSGNSEIAE